MRTNRPRPPRGLFAVPLALLLLALSALSAPVAFGQAGIEWVEVGDPGNPPRPVAQDPSGSVAYVFEMARTEVTNAQYAAFLGAVAGSDPNGLWSSFMQTNALGGIERSGLDGAFQYTVKPGMADKPVNYTSFWDVVRFANWLHNGAPMGNQDETTTEDGAYTITPGGVAANGIVRNPDALYAIPFRDEWLKAGYYEDAPQTWYESPAQSQSQMANGAPQDDDGNTGNCGMPQSVLYDVGSYTLSVSPWGTFDQGGNMTEWSETIAGGGSQRLWLGSSWAGGCAGTTPGSAPFRVPASELVNLGFRVVRLSPASVPLLGPGSIAMFVAFVSSLGVGRLARGRL